jgi:Flavodoxins
MISSCSNENKTLVAYFSATGTTKAVAEKIADKAGADLFEIKPAALYTEEDLNWRNKESRSSVEMIDPASRPEIAGKPAKLEKYETIYIGFPIWWYTAPRIINTFIEENDLAGKSVAFFATSGGSDIRKACNEFAEAYPEIKWLGGKLLNEPTDDDIAAFLSGEDLKQNAQLAGGYSEQREPSEEEIELFKKVTGEGDMVLTPLSVATQVVAGLNYRFYCRYEEQGADSGHCYVIIYKPLQGDPTLTKIEKL